MKKARKTGTTRSEERGLARSYEFDYRRSRPNRFAPVLAKDAVMVVLDPDVALVFRSARSVNAALRATIAARRKKHARGAE